MNAPRKDSSENGDIKIGNRVKQYRLGKGLTQKELAARTMISSSSITRLERGTSMVSVFSLIRIANELGVSADMLLKDRMEYPRKRGNHDFSKISAQLEMMPQSRQKQLLEVINAILRL